ncbi:MAG: hypothetical protein H7A35_16550 [Planctomycetales bacterium]|nr:hypothetical protein [bacterium]UNM08437.1 MAG: hypothetical protein H7A35_16550 [Planctomycetales bacterium]
MNQFLILGLHIIAVIGLLFFLRRLHNGLRRQSYRSMTRLADNAEMARRNIQRIEDEQWHERLNSNLRISRRQLGLSREQLAQLARIDEFQQSRLMR